jgi:hypothetical protein
MEQPWLTADAAGMAIGIAGGALVIACALFGSFSRWLARQGYGRTLVTVGFIALGALGLAAIALGLYAWSAGQPAYESYPCLGLGGAVVGALGLGLPGIVLRYRRAKQRRDLQHLAEQLIAGSSSRLLEARAHPPRRWR